jgi:hypothetical protein
MIEGRFATKKYHAPAAITTSRAVIAKAASRVGTERFFGSGGSAADAGIAAIAGFGAAGTPTCNE